jgi:hypothetical protein
MKRKIQHDAVNNQEDEDSCTYPIRYPGDGSIDKKKKRSGKNNVIHFSGGTSGNMDEIIHKPSNLKRFLFPSCLK